MSRISDFQSEEASASLAGGTTLGSKPQQTGTGLLIRHGEVATTSGPTSLARVAQQQRHGVESAASAGANPAASTNVAESSNSRTLGFEPGNRGASPRPAANSRPMVK